MKTGTHYIANGQRRLPLCLQNRNLVSGSTLIWHEELEGIGESEYSEICSALRALGWGVDLDDCGLTIT